MVEWLRALFERNYALVRLLRVLPFLQFVTSATFAMFWHTVTKASAVSACLFTIQLILWQLRSLFQIMIIDWLQSCMFAVPRPSKLSNRGQSVSSCLSALFLSDSLLYLPFFAVSRTRKTTLHDGSQLNLLQRIRSHPALCTCCYRDTPHYEDHT